MPAGEFTYVAKAEGFLDNNGKITTSSDKDTIEHVLMVGVPSTVHVKVTDEDTNDPIKDAVIAISQSNKQVEEGKTDANGEFVFKMLPGSDNAFSALAEGFLEKHDTFEAKSGQDTNLPIKLKKSSTTGKLLVTVTEDATNNPIEGANVAVEDKSAKTDKAGKADFELPAGNHQIVVTADGFEENRGNGSVTSGETAEVVFVMQKSKPEPEFKPPTSSKQPTLHKVIKVWTAG